MGHIFISYSHKDKGYVHRLQEALQKEGFEVWIDDRIDLGTTWPKMIQENLDACSAFIVVMTESAYESKWVHNEVTRAERKGKPFFALLLSGDTWLSLEAVQYENVTGGRLPSKKFYEALGRSALRKEKPSPPPVPRRPLVSGDAIAGFLAKIFPVVRLVGILLIIGFVIWGGSLVIPMIASSVPTATATATFTLTSKPITPLQTLETVQPSKTPSKTVTPAKNFTPTSTPLPAEITDAKGVSMMLVPAGEFTMGSENWGDDEKPVHQVYLDAFYVDKYEVTNILYKACVNTGKCDEPHNINRYNNPYYANHPVVFVDWNQADTYCNWRDTSLPTEAQWEKAARGTDGRRFPWGNWVSCDTFNYGACKGDTAEVGSYPGGVSPYGIFELVGNVWEWTADWYSESYYQNSPPSNPLGPDIGNDRVARGGSWANSSTANLLSGSVRFNLNPGYFDNTVGFRCAMDGTP